MFGTAAAAQRLHGIVPVLPTANFHGGYTQGLLELLEGQFDALAAASSTRNAALDQLDAATTQQYLEIKAAQTNLLAATPTPSRNSGTRTGSFPSDQRKTEKMILILQTAVKNKWKVEASAPHTATAYAPVTAAPTAMTKITATSTPQPAQVLLARERKSTRYGTTSSCERVGGRIIKIK